MKRSCCRAKATAGAFFYNCKPRANTPSHARSSDAAVAHPGVVGLAAEEGRTPGDERDKLKRALKLWDVVAITIGTIIGSGIFASANRVLTKAGSVGHMLMVWVCSGALVTLGPAPAHALALQWSSFALTQANGLLFGFAPDSVEHTAAATAVAGDDFRAGDQ